MNTNQQNHKDNLVNSIAERTSLPAHDVAKVIDEMSKTKIVSTTLNIAGETFHLQPQSELIEQRFTTYLSESGEKAILMESVGFGVSLDKSLADKPFEALLFTVGDSENLYQTSDEYSGAVAQAITNANG